MKTVLKNIVYLSLLLGFAAFPMQAQIQKGDKYFVSYNYPEAIKAYEFALKSGSSRVDYINLRVAESYRLMGDYTRAEVWYEKVAEAEKVNPVNFFYYGRMLESNEKYEDAQYWFQKFVEAQPSDLRAKQHEEYSVEKVSELLIDTKKYKLDKVSSNSAYDDFSPSYFGAKVVFASNRPNAFMVDRKHSWNNLPYTDLYVADRQDDDDLMDPNPLNFFNEKWHEGPVAFTSDLKRIFLTRNTSRGKKLQKGTNNSVNLMIFTSRKVTLESGEVLWTQPEPLSFNSVEYSCQHPALSSDGEKLYFASDQPGGFGGMDLYVSEKTVLGWSAPKNLGDKINTSGDEAFPFVSRSGDLYYASNGLMGIGGLDVFRAAVTPDSSFALPENLGYPINSVLDDFGMVLNGEETKGYITSNRKDDFGNSKRDEIYRITVLEKPKPKEKAIEVVEPVEPMLEVYVYDDIKKEGLNAAVVNIFDGEGVLLKAIQTDEEGSYISLRADYKGELRFIAMHSDFASNRVVVSVDTLPEVDTARINIPLSKDLGKMLSINPIYFDYDKSNIRPDAAIELDKIVKVMRENPTMVIEVASHTDSRGRNEYNEGLSERRAKSSREYIINKGISSSRIFGRGYGETQPANECEDGVECEEYKHQDNRRTEFKIVRF